MFPLFTMVEQVSNLEHLCAPLSYYYNYSSIILCFDLISTGVSLILLSSIFILSILFFLLIFSS
uniref:Putative ovule protein n=1 Tax=Solanum chacoense TaxID=4108 RepID=A0A0V0H6B3_SOLCH